MKQWRMLDEQDEGGIGNGKVRRKEETGPMGMRLRCGRGSAWMDGVREYRDGRVSGSEDGKATAAAQSAAKQASRDACCKTQSNVSVLGHNSWYG